MRKAVIIVAVVFFVALSFFSGAQGGHVIIGGYFGFPFYPYPYYGYYPYPYGYPYYYPYTYPYPSYSYSYPYTYNPPATVYIEPEQPYYWYFCRDSQTYYPYVTSCPSGWMKVVPTPPQAEKEEGTK